MKNIIHINFHDLVGLQVISNSGNVIDFYMDEYKNHIVKELDDAIPKVTLNLTQAFRPWINSERYQKASHKILAKWKFNIEFSFEKIQLDSYSNYFGIFMLHHMMVHPSIRYLAACQNVLMLHAGAVTKNGNSIIIAGQGGSGKTTTTSLLLAESVDITPHSDDYVFLNESNESLAYITRSHMYSDLLKWVPELSKNITWREKVTVYSLSTIRKISSDFLKWPTRIPQERLWPGKSISTRANISAIILLDRDDIPEPYIRENKQIHEYADKLIDMNFSEANHFVNLVSKQELPEYLEEWVATWREKEYGLLVDRLTQIPHYYLVLPNKINNQPNIKNIATGLLLDLVS